MTQDGFQPVNTDPFTPEARHIAVVSGGLGDPSSTRLLADRLTEAATAALSGEGIVPEVHVIELRLLATAISDALVTHNNSDALAEAIEQVEQADGIITTTPTFKATYSGLFKSFWDLIDDQAIVNVPVLLGATGGTSRHSLMIDNAMRPLFGYLKAKTIPTAVFAASDDWGEVEGAAESTRTTPLQTRIVDAGEDFAAVVARLGPRQRRASGELKPLEVVSFKNLLRGQR
ncbi:FMN reductase [Tessaracoccus sp. OS52]|uniref:FMN reductase n=1 Tax=Tessaracoccus sp. OS52 TaxID=2886691 RepID=UPI001D116AEF|nr:FMN reductase [Tessaracoccus sp. OS52]MCC2592253.1 FMN reductase [Tessaracoccus sp. OS52]